MAEGSLQLGEWMAAHAQRAWCPGKVDCLLTLADYAAALGHPDPAAHLRSTYGNEAGFRAIVRAAGGAVALVGTCVGRIGGRRAKAPVQGCIAVIGSADNLARQWGAIRHEERWCVRMEGGFAPLLARPLAMWSI